MFCRTVGFAPRRSSSRSVSSLRQCVTEKAPIEESGQMAYDAASPSPPAPPCTSTDRSPIGIPLSRKVPQRASCTTWKSVCPLLCLGVATPACSREAMATSGRSG